MVGQGLAPEAEDTASQFFGEVMQQTEALRQRIQSSTEPVDFFDKRLFERTLATIHQYYGCSAHCTMS